MNVSHASAQSKIAGKTTLGFVLLIVVAVGAAALAIVMIVATPVVAYDGPIWGLVILSGFPLVVFLALLVARRRGHIAPSLTLFCSRPIMSALISIYAVLGAASEFTYFGGPEIVGHILASPAKPELQFKYKLCPDDHAPVGSAVPPTIEWEGTNIARVSAIAESNCGTNWLFGNYAVSGDTITVEYQAIVSRYSLYNCAHQVSYRIRDIPKRGYIVQILARPEIYSRLWLWKLLGLVERDDEAQARAG